MNKLLLDNIVIKNGAYMSWYVSMENTIGQVTLTNFETEEKFNEWYAGTMKDGTGDPIKTAYPELHYQGPDMNECQRITEEIATQNYTDPLTPWIHFLAENVDIKSAEKLYRESRTAS